MRPYPLLLTARRIHDATYYHNTCPAQTCCSRSPIEPGHNFLAADSHWRIVHTNCILLCWIFKVHQSRSGRNALWMLSTSFMQLRHLIDTYSEPYRCDVSRYTLSDKRTCSRRLRVISLVQDFMVPVERSANSCQVRLLNWLTDWRSLREFFLQVSFSRHHNM
jgi:hypothetical protein